MKRWICIVALMAALVGMVGCNTFRGLGEDLQSVGEWVVGKSSE